MLKVMFNGIKGSDKKLQKAYLSYNCDKDNVYHISVYAQGYTRFSAEVRNLFSVKNNTDIMTDYFENDRFDVEKDHPMWNEFLRACIHDMERCLVRLEKKISIDLIPRKTKVYKESVEQVKKNMEKMKKDLKKVD